MRVPEEVGVTDFDGLRDDHLPAHELATVNRAWENVAVRALKKLAELIELRQKKQVPPSPEEVRLSSDTAAQRHCRTAILPNQ